MDIQDILVCCDNDERGCKLEGTISALREHVATCGFTSVPCPKECEDGAKTFLRRDTAKHLQQDCPSRDHVCEHCGEEGTHQDITEIHPQCHKVISCTNVACPQSIPCGCFE